MKIKCLKIFDIAKKEVDTNPWITIGKEYVVLSIDIWPNATTDKISYRIRSNQAGMPGLVEASQFAVVSNKLPTNWEIFCSVDGSITLTPRAWQEPGFWEDCYNGVPEALEIYKFEARIICEEEGMS